MSDPATQVGTWEHFRWWCKAHHDEWDLESQISFYTQMFPGRVNQLLKELVEDRIDIDRQAGNDRDRPTTEHDSQGDVQVPEGT